ncbi:F-box domain containing protein [Tanacetum coccineum]
MIWHATGKCTEPGKMQHPVDGGAWKKFDTKYPDFAKEPRNVRLGLAADGFNPFGNLSQAYSMWPMILTTYNLPPPLIEDLKVLWDRKGVETIDVALGQKFNIRAMDNVTLHIDGQSTVVDAPPDIIDVPDEDDDIIDDEDALPHDLADFDVEDLVNVDDDGVKKVYSTDVARSHDGDGGGEDRPPPPHVPTGCGGYFINRGKGKRKPNLGCRGAGSELPVKVRNLSLRNLQKLKAPSRFILIPCLDYCRTWNLTWIDIYEGIYMHLQKAYNLPKQRLLLWAMHWKVDPQTRTYDVEAIRQSTDPGRWLAFDETRQASDTQEYPSLIDTFWRTHTVDGVFLKDEDRRIYEEMKRLEATGEYTEDEINRLAREGKLGGHILGVGRVLPSRATSRPSMPAPDKSVKGIHKKVDFMMSLFRSDSKYLDMFKEFQSGGASGSGGCGDDEESGDDEEGEDEDGDGESLPRRFPSDMSPGKMYHRGTTSLTENEWDPHLRWGLSLGIVSLTRFPQRRFPSDMSLGIEAIHSYTEFLKELDKGNIENVKVPAVAVDYWRLPADATLRDVVMVVREDQAHHRDVNHFASDIHYEGRELKDSPAPIRYH